MQTYKVSKSYMLFYITFIFVKLVVVAGVNVALTWFSGAQHSKVACKHSLLWKHRRWNMMIFNHRSQGALLLCCYLVNITSILCTFCSVFGNISGFIIYVLHWKTNLMLHIRVVRNNQISKDEGHRKLNNEQGDVIKSVAKWNAK